MPTTTTLESFEHGLDAYSGDTSYFATDSSGEINEDVTTGGTELAHSGPSSYTNRVLILTTDAGRTTQRGDRLEFYFYHKGSSYHAVAFGGQTDDPSQFSGASVMTASGGDAYIQDWDTGSDSNTQIAQDTALPKGTTLKGIVQWGDDDTITFTVEQLDGTQVFTGEAAVSMPADTGGLGFSAPKNDTLTDGVTATRADGAVDDAGSITRSPVTPTTTGETTSVTEGPDGPTANGAPAVAEDSPGRTLLDSYEDGLGHYNNRAFGTSNAVLGEAAVGDGVPWFSTAAGGINDDVAAGGTELVASGPDSYTENQWLFTTDRQVRRGNRIEFLLTHKGSSYHAVGFGAQQADPTQFSGAAVLTASGGDAYIQNWNNGESVDSRQVAVNSDMPKNTVLRGVTEWRADDTITFAVESYDGTTTYFTGSFAVDMPGPMGAFGVNAPKNGTFTDEVYSYGVTAEEPGQITTASVTTATIRTTPGEIDAGSTTVARTRTAFAPTTGDGTDTPPTVSSVASPTVLAEGAQARLSRSIVSAGATPSQPTERVTAPAGATVPSTTASPTETAERATVTESPGATTATASPTTAPITIDLRASPSRPAATTTTQSADGAAVASTDPSKPTSVATPSITLATGIARCEPQKPTGTARFIYFEETGGATETDRRTSVQGVPATMNGTAVVDAVTSQPTVAGSSATAGDEAIATLGFDRTSASTTTSTAPTEVEQDDAGGIVSASVGIYVGGLAVRYDLLGEFQTRYSRDAEFEVRRHLNGEFTS